MNIKMIVMDMDGTLLSSSDEITDKTYQALMAAQAKGIRLVLASGRSYMKMMKYTERLEMHKHGGYLIEVNGMAVMDVTTQERTVFQQIDYEGCEKLFQVLHPYDVEQLYMLDDGMFHYLPQSILEKKIAYRKEHGYPDDYPLTASMLHYIYDNREGYPRLMPIQHVDEINQLINKVCVADEPDKLKKIADEIRPQFQDQFWLGLVGPRWLEITPLGISKGNRLLKLAEQLDVKPDEILCFGDGENDIDMIQSVTYGIAMGNALETVKKEAYAVTGSNHEDGIAMALSKYGII